MHRAKDTDVTYNLRSCRNEDLGTGFSSSSVEEAVHRAFSYRKFFQVKSLRVEVFNRNGEVIHSREIDSNSKCDSSRSTMSYPYNYF